MPKVVNLKDCTINGSSMSPVTIATDSLLSGNVIALPTDTIYGIASVAQISSAVDKLYDIKGRHKSKPLAICVGDVDDLTRWCRVCVSDALLHDLLPGPVTVVFERTDTLNSQLNPDTNLIGIRIPDYDFVRDIARACNQPLALTSANLSSAGSTVAVNEFKSIWGHLDVIFDGGKLIADDETSSRLGSTVVNLSVSGFFTIIRNGSAYQRTIRLLTEKHGLKELKTH